MAARPHLLRHCAAIVIAAASAGVWAAPQTPSDEPAEPGSDVVMQMLQQRGLVASNVAESTQDFVQQFRDKASDLVMSSMNFLGVPYRRGGNNAEEGFDCSGFTRHVFERSIGLVLPRRAAEQAKDKSLVTVARDELKPGDLVFFNTMRRAFSHVGIYIGEGKFIHAPRTGSEVRIEDMRQAYWTKRFNGGRRAELTADTAPIQTLQPRP